MSHIVARNLLRVAPKRYNSWLDVTGWFAMSAVPPNSLTFSLAVRVYYEDTDAGGVVYYANYLRFFERARTEWLRSLGFGQADTAQAEGRIFVVRSASVDYRRPARLDDLLQIHSRLGRIGRASLSFIQHCERDGELIANGRVDVVCVDAAALRPAELPARLARRLTIGPGLPSPLHAPA